MAIGCESALSLPWIILAMALRVLELVPCIALLRLLATPVRLGSAVSGANMSPCISRPTRIFRLTRVFGIALVAVMSVR